MAGFHLLGESCCVRWCSRSVHQSCNFLQFTLVSRVSLHARSCVPQWLLERLRSASEFFVGALWGMRLHCLFFLGFRAYRGGVDSGSKAKINAPVFRKGAAINAWSLK